jgi:hypothetical protein
LYFLPVISATLYFLPVISATLYSLSGKTDTLRVASDINKLPVFSALFVLS